MEVLREPMLALLLVGGIVYLALSDLTEGSSWSPSPRCSPGTDNSTLLSWIKRANPRDASLHP
jgi:hypothetical protein